ncbi:hypothetical protein LCGC14_1224910 [marine sediment metagenome]|uniref:Uncharacterized protein n=1 Tax=marine sediment metagenome TaxID=412755 RepID=A0A0F9NSK4_9ZZZZ
MICNDFNFSIRKTKIVEIDKDAHILPPDYGPFPEYKVADYLCPEAWSRDGFFIPVKEGQPLWIDLRGNNECACIISVQRLNPITGKAANLKDGLQKDPEQNYLTLPEQKWIDGYVNEGKVYQFIITKKGEGLAVNEYLLPEDMQDSHAIGLAFFGLRNPKPKEAVRIIYCGYPYYSQNPFNYPRKPLPLDNWYDPSYWTNTWKNNVYSGTITDLSSNTGWSNVNCERALQCTGGHIVHAEVLLQHMSQASASGQTEFRLPQSSMSCASAHKKASSAFSRRSKTQYASNCIRTFNKLHGIPGMSDASEDCVETFTQNAMSPDTDDILDIPENLDKASMGAGGRIEQEILADPNTVEYYTKEPSATIPIYLALPEQFASIIKKGKRQDVSKKDKWIHSGKIGSSGVQVPLIKANS